MGKVRPYCFNAADHKSGAKDGHVQMIEFFLFPCLEKVFCNAIGDIFTPFHAGVNVEEQATICLDKVGMELLTANLHVIPGNFLEDGNKVCEIGDRTCTVPKRTEYSIIRRDADGNITHMNSLESQSARATRGSSIVSVRIPNVTLNISLSVQRNACG